MKSQSSGFTLIELLIVVVIVGVTLAIGLPSYTPLITKTRMDGEISGLVGALNLARSEAQKRGLPVSVCPTSNGTSCGSGTSWSSPGGWIVQLNGPPTQLLQAPTILPRDTLTSTSTATPSYPQFTSIGYTFFTGTLTLHDANDTVNLRRCLVFASGTWTSNTGATCP